MQFTNTITENIKRKQSKQNKGQSGPYVCK